MIILNPTLFMFNTDNAQPHTSNTDNTRPHTFNTQPQTFNTDNTQPHTCTFNTADIRDALLLKKR